MSKGRIKTGANCSPRPIVPVENMKGFNSRHHCKNIFNAAADSCWCRQNSCLHQLYSMADEFNFSHGSALCAPSHLIKHASLHLTFKLNRKRSSADWPCFPLESRRTRPGNAHWKLDEGIPIFAFPGSRCRSFQAACSSWILNTLGLLN